MKKPKLQYRIVEILAGSRYTPEEKKEVAGWDSRKDKVHSAYRRHLATLSIPQKKGRSFIIETRIKP